MKPLSTRIKQTDSRNAFYIWYKALELEAQGVDMIHLIIGEPDFATPAHIMTTASEAIRSGRTKYESVKGTPAFRAAAARYFERSRGIKVNPEHIFAASGVKSLLFFTILALLDEGDELLVPSLSFPAYREIIQIAGGVEVEYALDDENGFQPDLDSIRNAITPRTKGIILNSPSNPTGTIITESVMAGIADIVRDNGIYALLDEIYYQMSFLDTPTPTLYSYPDMPEHCILMDGLSKAYGMTGWRFGFAVYPESMLAGISMLLINNHSNLPPFITDAATAALAGPQENVARIRQMYRDRRDLMHRLLSDLPGLKILKADGSFYLWVDMSGLPDHENFVDQLLHNGVAVLPGTSFGPAGTNHFRISLTQPADRLREAATRIRKTVSQQVGHSIEVEPPPKVAAPLTHAQVIARELKAAGIQYVFGQPGGEVVDLLEALAREGIEFILMGVENAAALAAATLGHATGLPGICLTTLGPGAANMALGIADAYLDRHPLLAISARTAVEQQPWYNHQALPLNEMYAPITKASIALSGESTAVQVRDALKLAASPMRGPVYLTLPGDLAAQPSRDGNESEISVIADAIDVSSQQKALKKIAHALNVAHRPVVVLGIALDQRQDGPAIRQFLQTSGLPFADTPKNKGVVDPNLPNYLGTYLSASGDKHINAVIQESDCILGIGFDPVETTYQWHLGASYHGIVDTSTSFGTFQPESEAVGDVGQMVTWLSEHFDGAPIWELEDFASIRARVATAITPETRATKQGLAPLAVVQTLREGLPANTAMVVDTGQHKMIMAQAWQTTKPLSYFNSNGLSSMSTAVPGAIALALQDRDRPVVCVAGDGGFGMMVQELETVSRLGIAPLFIVMADQALSLIRLPQQLRGYASRGIDLAPVDWAKVAEGFGIRGVWARTEDSLASAINQWVKMRAATVISIPIDESLYRGNSY